MDRKISFFCCISILILLWGCKPISEPDSEDIMTLKIEINKNKISFPLSEIAEKVDVIELEINDNSLIRSIKQVDILDNYYIIYDGSPGVLVYDSLGNFIRRIGKRGQGPGELTSAVPCQVDYNKGTILFNLPKKMVIYDINGKHITDIQHDLLLTLAPFYYLNDSIFYIDESWDMRDEYVRTVYFKIYNYSNGDFLDNITDSFFVDKSEPLPGVSFNMNNRPFRHQDQVYFFFPIYDDECYLYVYKNHQFEHFAKIILKSDILKLSITDSYVIAAHGYSRPAGEQPTLLTPDMIPALRSGRPTGRIWTISYYVYDYKTGRSIDSYKGFIDDFHHRNDTIPITIMDGGEKFFYTREHDYSEALGTEPNPTLYIGTFKK